MSRIYSKFSTFDIARDDALGINVFGVWYRNDTPRYFVAQRGVTPMSEFTTASAALQSFELLCDKAEEEATPPKPHALNVKQTD